MIKTKIKRVGVIALIISLVFFAIYTSSASAKGVTGTMLDHWSTLQSVKKGVKDKQLTDDEVADLVILGLFGNGEERVINFKKVGVDGQQIQELVNEKLSKEKALSISLNEVQVEWVNENVVSEVGHSEPDSQEVYEEPTQQGSYSLGDLQFHGIINWSGYKFTYYSQRV